MNWSELGSVSQELAAGTVYHLKVVASGAQISSYFNNASTAATSLTDTSYPSGKMGVRVNGAAGTFDNIEIRPVP